MQTKLFVREIKGKQAYVVFVKIINSYKRVIQTVNEREARVYLEALNALDNGPTTTKALRLVAKQAWDKYKLLEVKRTLPMYRDEVRIEPEIPDEVYELKGEVGSMALAHYQMTGELVIKESNKEKETITLEKNLYYRERDNVYIVSMGVSGKRIRRTFRSLDEAKAFKLLTKEASLKSI